MDSKMYLHVDLDAFFASVEVLDNPELKGKPLIVGGLPGERRSVVSTCSYEARSYGVHSAMPINRAYELCPNAIFVHGRMARYHEKSQEVMDVFREFSPDVMQMSVDEAFIDITGTEMLFGPPEVLAKNLKKRVLDKTGLTVSVGIASNRYVAKIASGLKKPDGLCYVPRGDEEKFMLSLPLDKLWGIGTKSRERLNGCGIFSIPEIHAISETALKELFGEASGSFLYRSVRGMDVEHFGDETKSRSLSAERTFCFDLSDIYSIETELLHLSYDVMFRVLREKVNSKTVCLKIRYEDFTTVTVTESSTRIVSSIEDLFERSCRLFHKKYERGRGIRLLGLGLQNVNDGLESEQGELFDFGEKKQRSVEKTVLKLHQKNPAAKIKKARQLITSCIAPLFFFFMWTGMTPPLYAAPVEGLNTPDIEFDVEGSWESVLSGGASVIIGDSKPVIAMQTAAFIQKANLLAWFMYDNHWYFDASIDTESDTDKIAAGYLGDGIIKELRIGTDTGTEGMSPGISLSLQGNTWDADGLIHLDTVRTYSKTWQGTNELVSSNIPFTSFIKGKFFSVINASVASQITAVFIEDADGTWTDEDNHHFRRLSQDEYLLLPAKGMLYLETAAKGAVIAAVTDRPSVEAPLTLFLKDTDDWFGDRGSISTYCMMGLSCTDEASGPSASETAPLFTSIQTGTASSFTGLYLKRSGFFSPFEIAALYDHSSDESSAVLSVDVQSLHAQYASPVLMKEGDILIQLYDSSSSSSGDFSSASSRFPAARLYPEVYLPSNGITDSIIPSIATTEAQRSDSYVIGTKAIENSVRVLKNGSYIPAFYDRISGVVTPGIPCSSSDTLTIFWNEYSSESEDMTLSAGAGFHASPSANLSFSGNLSSSLYLDPESHSLSSSPEHLPYATGTLNGEWQHSSGNFTVSASNSLTVNGTFAVQDAKAPLLSFTGSGTVPVWFTEGASVTSSVPVLNKRPSDTSAILPVLSETKRQQGFSIQSTKAGGSTGQNITIEGTLSRNTDNSPSWVSFDIPLSAGSTSLPSAHAFSFFMEDLKKASSAYDVYLKLGDSLWLISASQASHAGTDVLSPLLKCSGSTAPVKVLLTDADRQKLIVSHSMSIIIVNTNESGDTDIKLSLRGNESAISGISFNISSYNASGSSFRLPVTAEETSSASSCISWNTLDAPSGSTIHVDRCIPEIALSRYKKASLTLFIPDDVSATDITVYLQKHTDEGYETSQSFILTEDELSSHKGDWYTVTQVISSEDTISRVQIILNAHPATDCSDERIYIRGIFLSDPVSSYTGSDTATAKLHFSQNDFSADLSVDATGSASYTERFGETALISSVRASLSAPWCTVSGNGSFNTRHATLLFGDYCISTGNAFLSGVISLSEEYRFTKQTDEEKRKDSLALSLLPLSIPLSAKAAVETERKGSDISGKTAFLISVPWSSGETEASLTVSQTKAPADSFSYFGSQDAEKRTEAGAIKQTLILADGRFTPSFEAGFSSAALKNESGITGTFSQKMTLPFVVSSNTMAFGYERQTTAVNQNPHVSSSFTDDIHRWADSFSIHKDALSIAPVYDLFSDTLIETLRNSLENAADTSRSSYTSSASISWIRPIRADWLDLLLPNTATLSAERTISQAGLNTLDVRSTSLFIAYTAFNCLGSSSATPVFTWYEQDETQFSARFTLTPDVLKTEINGYGTLYISDDAQITTLYTGKFSGNGICNHTAQFTWNRPSVIFGKDAVRITAGSAGVSRETASSSLSVTSGLSHKANIQINDNLSILGSASCSATFKEKTSLIILLSIGGKYAF